MPTNVDRNVRSYRRRRAPVQCPLHRPRYERLVPGVADFGAISTDILHFSREFSSLRRVEAAIGQQTLILDTSRRRTAAYDRLSIRFLRRTRENHPPGGPRGLPAIHGRN